MGRPDLPSLPAATSLAEQLRRIRVGPPGPQVAAFFDFDGTLIDGYSAAVYFKDRLLRRDVDLDEIADLLAFSRLDEPGTADFERLLGGVAARLAGQPEQQWAETWTRLFRQRIAAMVFPEAWQLVQAHRQMGHTLVIASSATAQQVAAVADEFQILHRLTSHLASREGLLTGHLDGTPLWGPEKAAAARRFAKEQGLRLRDCHAYANGDEDRDFLSVVGRPCAINAQPQLARLASERGWPRLDFAPQARISLGDRLRTISSYAAMAASFLGGVAYDRLTGERRRALDLVSTLGTELGLLFAGIELRVQGEQHLWSQRPAVFIFNHQSPLDLVIGLKLAQRSFTGVVKKEAAEVPGFGAFMRFADMAFVDRGDAQAARAALAPAVEKLRRGLSVGICPEGTRSYSPRLGPFKKGAFHLAMQAGVPVVPVVMRNVGERMWRNGVWMRPGTVDVMVLPPISVAGWKPAELDQRIAAVRQQFIDTLAEWPQEQA
ncbi:MAG TPA: HAD-IB family hydrolase [Solimonas sp.]|nr:HAD-IB family hydrolase [Solimonas sp.]